MNLIRIFLTVFVFTATAKEFGEPMMMSAEDCMEASYCPPSTTPTSIVALLGCPDCWEDKAIKVSGWITYDPHGSTLFMSTEHCEHNLYEYGSGVRLKKIEESKKFIASQEICQLVEVQGVYRPIKNRGPKPDVIRYRDLWAGIIDAEYLIFRK